MGYTTDKYNGRKTQVAIIQPALKKQKIVDFQMDERKKSYSTEEEAKSLDILMKEQHININLRHEEDNLAFPHELRILGCFYFSCAPVAVIGLFLGGQIGFVVALSGNILAWLSMILYRNRI